MKRFLAAILIGVSGGAFVAPSASAGELFSGFINAGAAQSLVCVAANVGKKDVRVLVELFTAGEYDGTPGEATNTFAPGASSIDLLSGSVTAFCRVTFSGSKKGIRAVVRVIDADGLVAAVPLD